jgi:hypothetical protein
MLEVTTALLSSITLTTATYSPFGLLEYTAGIFVQGKEMGSCEHNMVTNRCMAILNLAYIYLNNAANIALNKSTQLYL